MPSRAEVVFKEWPQSEQCQILIHNQLMRACRVSPAIIKEGSAFDARAPAPALALQPPAEASLRQTAPAGSLRHRVAKKQSHSGPSLSQKWLGFFSDEPGGHWSKPAMQLTREPSPDGCSALLKSTSKANRQSVMFSQQQTNRQISVCVLHPPRNRSAQAMPFALELDSIRLSVSSDRHAQAHVDAQVVPSTTGGTSASSMPSLDKSATAAALAEAIHESDVSLPDEARSRLTDASLSRVG